MKQVYADPYEMRDITFFMPKPSVPKKAGQKNQQGFKPPKGPGGGRGGARGGFGGRGGGRGAPRGGGFRGGGRGAPRGAPRGRF